MFVGEDINAVHVAPAAPRMGHSPFSVMTRSGVPTLPFTLSANKAAPNSGTPGEMTWESARALASGTVAAVDESLSPASETRNLLYLVAVWVSPRAVD